MTDTPAQSAARAYLYGFPLVFNLDEVINLTVKGLGVVPPAPFNVFGHARTLAGPADKFVTINNDTIYSIAQVDLGVGPVRFGLPAVDRYIEFQFVDAWSNNFAYVGERATGRGAQEYLVVPPGWSGQSDVPVIHAPTRIVSIVGRLACAGEHDLPAVGAVQDAIVLAPVDATAAPTGVPATVSTGDEALDWWEKYRVWSQAFPPAPHDIALQETLAPFGLTGDTPVAQLDEGIRAALTQGYQAGAAQLDQIIASGGAAKVNGWAMTMHMFDYNVDFFEIGALDEPQWRIDDPQRRYATRAVAAKAGLWGNHGYEAVYLLTYEDGDGNPLSGEHEYELHLDPAPPVDAFWSVTMYDTPDFYLVDNPIDRYSIGDRTTGLVADADGAVTIHMSAKQPADATAAANWLPAPTGTFRPVLRMYVPKSAVLDGTYVPPAITRVR